MEAFKLQPNCEDLRYRCCLGISIPHPFHGFGSSQVTLQVTCYHCCLHLIMFQKLLMARRKTKRIKSCVISLYCSLEIQVSHHGDKLTDTSFGFKVACGQPQRRAACSRDAAHTMRADRNNLCAHPRARNIFGIKDPTRALGATGTIQQKITLFSF